MKCINFMKKSIFLHCFEKSWKLLNFNRDFKQLRAIVRKNFRRQKTFPESQAFICTSFHAKQMKMKHYMSKNVDSRKLFHFFFSSLVLCFFKLQALVVLVWSDSPKRGQYFWYPDHCHTINIHLSKKHWIFWKKYINGTFLHGFGQECTTSFNCLEDEFYR